MRILICSVFFYFILSSLLVNAQQDPFAKKFLDQSAEKTKSYKSIQADFEMVISDKKENNSTNSKGYIKIKGEKYILSSLGTLIYFDGTTMWSYNNEFNEVSISNPDKSDEDFLSNPAKIVTWYNRDFKYRYVKETSLQGIKVHEIDLFPKNLEQPYSKIKFFIETESLLIKKITSIGKDGVDYTILLKNYLLNKELTDELFVFDPKKYKNIEIIDMRY